MHAYITEEHYGCIIILVSSHMKTSTINPLSDRIENVEKDLGLTGSYTKNPLYAIY
jgi:hypothetical protein